VTISQDVPAGPAAAAPTWALIDDEQCRRATRTVELLGRRWSSGILLAIARGAVHFSAITASVKGLSDRMLAVRLKELQRAGLVERVVEPTTPVSVHYRLTPRGRELLEALQPIVRFGLRWDPPRLEDD